MNILTLYLSRFDDPTMQDEIVQVLSVMSAIGSMCSRLISSGAELTNVVTYLYGAQSLRRYRSPRFSRPCQGPPPLIAELIGAVLALNGSKVVPRRCISSTNTWSRDGLRVVLEPSYLAPCRSTRR